MTRVAHLLTAALCLCTLLLSAQTSWTGTTDSNWSTASNWSNGIPAAGNDATIPLGSMSALTLTANTIFDYAVNNQGELMIDLAGFNLNNNGLFLNDGTATINGSGTLSNLDNITNNGDFSVNSIFTNSFSGTLVNMGTMNLNSTVINFSDLENLADLNLNGDLDNGGTINNRPTGILVNNANLDNLGGFVVNNEGTIINALNWSNFGEFNNSDTLQNQSVFLNDGAGVLNNLPTGVVLNENRFTNQNTISNEGNFENTSCNIFTGQNGSTTVNVGTGLFTNSGILYQLGTAVINISTGTGIVLTEANETAAPDMTCFSDITVDLDADGLYNLTLNEVDNGSTVGYCNTASRILSESNFTCENIGDNPVTLTITDGFGTSNTCQTIVNVRDNTPPTLSCPSDILLDLNPGDCNETITYDITSDDNCDFTLVQTDDSGLTSGDVFPAGVTEQTYKAQDSGFVVTCTFTVTINGLSSGQAMSCNNQLNISLDENCHYEFTPNALLSGAQICDANYTIEINDISQTIIDETYIGQNLMVSVIHTETGNSCWGNALIEDKLAPVINDCDDYASNCLGNTDPVSEGGMVPEPTFEDCSEYYSFYIDQTTQGTCSDGYSRIINRTWTVTDVFGRSTTCVQVITVERFTLSNSTLECPADFVMECVADQETDISPENTGYPNITFNGTIYTLDENSGNVCDIAVTHSDNDLDMCNGARKIMRTWSIYDWCQPLGAGNPYTCTQFIEITDNTAPTILTPDDFTVSVGADCQAVFEIPPADYEDCSNEITWKTLTSVGLFDGNGGTVPTPGFPIGTQEIIYIATDACGNTTSDTIEVTIIDEIIPIAVCHFDVQVALSGGTAQLTPAMIDNGSTDNCCLETILIAKMEDTCGNPDDLLFGTSVGLCCEDIGEETLVSLQVTDCYGNENFCMVPVEVVDNEMPTITCPPDKTLECDENPMDLGLTTGEAIGIDDCGETTVTFEDEGTISCEGGVIMRTFTVTDNFGNTAATCVQMLTVLGTEPITPAHFTCPQDYNAEGCTPNTDPTTTGQPTFDLPACAEVSVDYSDAIFPGTADYCMKIIRTWVITDACHFNGNPSNGGYFECVQSIFIGNSEAPTLVCPTSPMPICSGNNTCEAENVDLSIEASDDCTAEENLQIFWTVDIFNDGLADTGLAASGLGQNTTNTYPVGVHQITYTVKDACANSTSCSFPFFISDCGDISPVCPNGINIELATDATVTLYASQINMSSTTGSCSTNDNLTTSFSTDINDTSLTFSCSDVGPANVLTIYVTDSGGNQGSCTTTIGVQDNMNVCPNSLMIAGAVATEQGEMVEQVMVELEGAEMIQISTDEAGHYEYENGAFGQDYSLTPQSANDWGNGITTWDILSIRRHILNTEILNSPYKLIAADVNGSGTITTADVIALRSFILQLTDEFSNNTSWRYIDENYDFPEPTNPWLEAFPEEVNLPTLSGSAMQNNFIAVKIGDMNGTASTNGLMSDSGEERSGDNFNLRIIDQEVAANEEITIEIFPEDLERIYAYQMTFDFDTEALEFLSLQQGEGHQRSNFGLGLLEDGAITCSWDKAFLSDLNTNGSLFSVKFRARNATVLSKVLNVSSRFTQALAYTESGEAMNIQLSFSDENGQDATADNFALYQNRPNPFRETTQIGFNLPMASEVSLKIYDAAGRLVKSIEQNAIAGYNQITLSAADLPMRAVLYYELVTPTHKATKKMILTK